MELLKNVIPAKAGIQKCLKLLDPCLRRDDKVSAQRIPIQPVEIESLLDLLFYKFATYLRKNLKL